ncbi:Asparagine synthetase B [glutamine-hydrolyzing] [bacterium HR17]|jgi:asparagine synthase (glutamine-hydrolysing)|uniref:asparagine synthase (glutamine-hydrolyzing) n=1 Tax=Candidatus Fervidibacter japonicus TaxID=2035412 RepID=A0A2H5XGF3_9BACT|nr:Asparagine synthetase B [glutamine-hydrolyzing] [bacterium HR17]
MCGIAVIYGGEDPDLADCMVRLLSHRGPDGKGVAVLSKTALAHCRLSIIDPAGGHQPLFNEDKSCAVIANGEIYNHGRLRQSLAARHQFRTLSDSEVLVHLYEEHGVNMVSLLDGMFAFAVTDGERLLVARDHIGIKPLYCGVRKEGGRRLLLFASEMKALAPFVDAIYELPPGSYYDTETGWRRYYMVPDPPLSNKSIESWVREVRTTLERSVVKQLMSDVPLGVFLSGGLDSAIIAAIAKRHMSTLHTFTVGIEGSHDLEAARLVARHIGSEHHEYIFTPQEVLRHLTQIIYHLESFDQDVVRSAIPTYFCSRLASDWVKVVLCGEGADELFAGYRYYKSISDPASLHKELRRSLMTLHNINLQRVDRMTMAHGLEGRVPFLDKEMIALALKIPPRLKLPRTDKGQLVEKWLLRIAFEDLLPKNIVWRTKEQFDEGSGTVQLLADIVRESVKDWDVHRYAAQYAPLRLQSPEECLYHRIFTEVFERSQLMVPSIGRWSQRAYPQAYLAPIAFPL